MQSRRPLEAKKRLQAAEMRYAIIEGYCDLLAGRVVEYKGDVRSVCKEARRHDQRGWKS